MFDVDEDSGATCAETPLTSATEELDVDWTRSAGGVEVAPTATRTPSSGVDGSNAAILMAALLLWCWAGRVPDVPAAGLLTETVDFEETVDFDEAVDFDETVDIDRTVDFDETVDIDRTVDFDETVDFDRTVDFATAGGITGDGELTDACGSAGSADRGAVVPGCGAFAPVDGSLGTGWIDTGPGSSKTGPGPPLTTEPVCGDIAICTSTVLRHQNMQPTWICQI
jgi:hypothetical protein